MSVVVQLFPSLQGVPDGLFVDALQTPFEHVPGDLQ